MKSVLFTFLTTFLFNQAIVAQLNFNGNIDQAEYECKYVMTAISDDLEQSFEFILLVGNNHTLFIEERKLLRDSALAKLKNPDLKMQILGSLGSYRGGPKTKLLYNRISNVATVVEQPVVKSMYYEEKIALDWELTDNTKMLGNVECQQAFVSYAGRKYSAWYSKRTSLPVGPHKFYGLPGLIVYMEDTEGLFKFQLKSFKKSGGRPISLYEEYKPLKSSKSEIRKTLLNFIKNPQFGFESEGVTIDGVDFKSKKIPEPVFMEILESDQ